MMKMATEKPEKSKAQRALDAKAKYEQLLEDGKNELLETANQAITELKELGFTYRLLSEDEWATLARQSAPMAPRATKTAKTASNKPTPAASPSANYNPDKKCEVCGGKHGHDGRAHRGGQPAFTKEQLAERGILPPDGAPEQQSLV